jgi:hypothetical protein
MLNPTHFLYRSYTVLRTSKWKANDMGLTPKDSDSSGEER